MRVLILAGLLSASASAQVSVVRPVQFSAVTSGYRVGILTADLEADESPAKDNYIYTTACGAVNTWAAGDFPNEFQGRPLLHTDCLDQASQGDFTIASVTVDRHVQVCVWHADGITSKPSWLTSNYADSGHDAELPDGIVSLFCAPVVSPGTINFGGNYAPAGSGSDPMYVVTIAPAYAQVPASTPGSAGFMRFTSQAVSFDESTMGNVVGTVERHSGSAGAVGGQVYDTATGTCSALDYTLTPTTRTSAWSSAEVGESTATMSLDTDAVSAQCTIVLGLQFLTGGLQADPIAGTSTITVLDVDMPSTAAEFFINGSTGSDANDGLTAMTAWATPGRANSVSHPGGAGHVRIYVTGGPIRGLWEPTNSGLSSTQRILMQCDGVSNIKWYGPTSGTIDNFFDVEGVSYVGIANDPVDGCYLDLDGENTVTKNGGTPSGGHVRYIGWISGSGTGRVFELKTTATNGYRGLNYSSGSASSATKDCWNLTNMGRHGQTYVGGAPGDHGNQIELSSATAGLEPFHRITGEECVD